MPESYTEIEIRITKAIDALNTRKNAKLRAIARGFEVLRERLRSRYHGAPSKSEIRGMHTRRLKPDQESTLYMYIKKLDSLNIPARLHMVQIAANFILYQTAPVSEPPPLIGSYWTKRRLNRQPDLFKVRRKPLAVERTNAHDLDLLMAHYTKYEEVIDEYSIDPQDQWNFDDRVSHWHGTE